MNKISIDDLKKLRKKTQAPVLQIRQALEEAKGDIKKAEKELKKAIKVKADKKKDKETSQGIVESYIHTGGRVGALIVLKCQTDFVSRNQGFINLAHEIAMQVASMNAKDIKTLLDQPYIRDPQRTIRDLIEEQIARLGENIKITEMIRFAI